MKKFGSFSLAILGMCMLGSTPVWAGQNTEALETATAFMQEIAKADDDYVAWTDAELRYGYELLGVDMMTPVGDLYYVETNSQNAGYMIVDNTDFSVLEFSVGAPAYDMYQQEIRDASPVYLYINFMPSVYSNGIISDINQSGEVLHTFDMTNNVMPRYNPNIQGGNCIRPCLLGFAAGSSYSDTVGHMTVCVGTRTANSVNYCKVMDGHSTSVVEKQWSSYNDFMSKVALSK